MIKHTISQPWTLHKRLPWLIAGVAGISTIAWFVNTYAPFGVFLGAFFLILFVTVSAFAFSITNNLRWTLLSAGGVVGFFLLRMLELREPIYLVLLLSSLLSLEVYLNKR